MKPLAFLLVCLLITACVDFAKAETDASNADQSRASKTKFKVTTILEDPYVMRGSNSAHPFEGLIPDILEKIEKRLNISFEFSHVADGKYGSMSLDGNWTGMIGEITDKKADIAAAALTITADRQEVVDFSHPFMDAGIRILIKEPASWNSLETVFILLAPYRPEIWVIGLLMFVAVSILLYLIGRYSPEERSRIYDDDGLTLNNSFFLSFAAFMLQGYHTIPRSVAARVLICFWWMFTLFFVVGYAANLTAFFLTKEPIKRTLPVMSFGDLARGTVSFGSIKSDSIKSYFHNSTNIVDKHIAAYFSKHEGNLLNSVQQGIDRVRNENGNFAFIMEGTAAEYHAGRTPCDLMVVGESKIDREYGFACSKDDGICSRLSVAILMMKETNEMNVLKRKWFSGNCFSANDEEYVYNGLPFFRQSRAADITMEKGVTLKIFGAPITFICVGIGLSIVTVVVEIILKGRTRKLPGHSTLQDDEIAIQDTT